ncbi:hypothetical protein GF359_10715 [candidate division WOR-3 bacterium]|uniref:Uncharacterized protein n=1 Tax=candidate division WOR-3 bacterium TaxID=2052148 RepID=A0A9D5KAR9_UNCW3|nr:hypothetical protein [candidate division WOR-3 bacterium]MBD3365673.1 hypothetical protein [candidate division WOR-3 bacterium]
MEAAETTRIESWMKTKKPDKMQPIELRKVKRFMPSSHTYPVTAGLCPAVTFYFGDVKSMPGSSWRKLNSWILRCPEPAHLRPTSSRSAHLGSPHPGILLANYDMHIMESGHHNHLDRQAFENTVWGVTQGHLFFLKGCVLYG